MKRRWFSFILVLIMILPIAVISVSANSAPSPDFIISFSGRFSGIEGTCYLTVLYEKIDEDDYYHVSPDGKRDPEIFDIELFGHVRPDEIAEPIFQAFNSYKDPDGYLFVQDMADVTDGKEVFRTYPPEHFKLLLYFPDTGKLTASEKLTSSEYFNTYDVTVKDQEIISVVSKSTLFDGDGWLPWYTVGLLLLLLQTIIVELLIALLFRFYRKRQILTIICTNLLTHTTLTGLLVTINPPIHGSLFSFPFAFFEIGVAAVEALVYLWLFPKFETERKINKWLIVAYAVAANLVTYAISAIPGTSGIPLFMWMF